MHVDTHRYRAEIFFSPFFISTVMALTRGALIVLGVEQWFIGHSLVFTVYGVAVVRQVVQRLFSPVGAAHGGSKSALVVSAETEPATAATTTSTADTTTTPTAAAAAAAPAAPARTCCRARSRCTTKCSVWCGCSGGWVAFSKSPQLVLLVLTAFFSADLGVAWSVRVDTLPLPEIQLVDASVEQCVA